MVYIYIIFQKSPYYADFLNLIGTIIFKIAI